MLTIMSSLMLTINKLIKIKLEENVSIDLTFVVRHIVVSNRHFDNV